MTIDVTAVVVINPDLLDAQQVPISNFDRMLYNLNDSGLFSACTYEGAADFGVSVDYMTSPEFRHAMNGYEPVVSPYSQEITNLSPLARGVKERIDNDIRGLLQQAQVWSATGIADLEIMPYTPFSPLANDHRRAVNAYVREGRIADHCPAPRSRY